MWTFMFLMNFIVPTERTVISHSPELSAMWSALTKTVIIVESDRFTDFQSSFTEMLN